jgi:5-methylcytosine-specific restriction endonuclease McrA
MSSYPFIEKARSISADNITKVYPDIQQLSKISKISEKQKKEKIPKAIREQVWKSHAKNQFEIKCPIRWCNNVINSFDFHVGHNIPESKGGTLEISNLRPICSRCNLSMGAHYTIDEWNKLANPAETPRSCKCSIM